MLAHCAWNNSMPNVHGTIRCPMCMEQFDAQWSKTLGEMIYGHYRRKLSLDHPFHMILQMYFDNMVEGRPLHHRCTTSNLLNLWVTIVNNFHILGMNMLLTLNSQLEYWKELPIQHLFNPMHIMKNVCHFFILHLQRVKDTDSVKDDLEESNIEHILW